MNKKKLLPLVMLSALSMTSLAIADNNEYINVTDFIKITAGPLSGKTVDLQVEAADQHNGQITYFMNYGGTIKNIYMLHDNPPTILDTYVEYTGWVDGQTDEQHIPPIKIYYTASNLPCDVLPTVSYDSSYNTYTILAKCAN